MPLKEGTSKKTFDYNLHLELAHGKSLEQSLAIALSKKREAEKKKKKKKK